MGVGRCHNSGRDLQRNNESLHIYSNVIALYFYFCEKSEKTVTHLPQFLKFYLTPALLKPLQWFTVTLRMKFRILHIAPSSSSPSQSPLSLLSSQCLSSSSRFCAISYIWTVPQALFPLTGVFFPTALLVNAVFYVST